MRDRGAARRWLAGLMVGTALGCGTLALAVTARPAAAQTAQSYRFDIPRQPLASALRAFSDQSGIQVAYATVIAAGLTAPAVSGELTAAEALARLLAGSGLSYDFSGSGTVTILDPAQASGGTKLILSPVMVTDASGGNPADAPFETVGSSVHISREVLDRVPPSSMGDVFKSTSGVISSGNRIGGGLDVNIRGLQGMNRVATLVDGTQQGTSTYHGYRGFTSSVYVDPDLIGGIDITKGPSDGPYGAGAMGGVVYLRTLEAGDIVQPGETFGVRLKGSLGSNTINPVTGLRSPRDETDQFMSAGSYSVSLAGAVMTERYEFLLALSRRKQGNYIAGENGDEPIQNGTLDTPLAPGKEVFNSSEDVRSLLTKGKLYFGDSHSLELGYTYYENRHGWLNDSALTMPLYVVFQQEQLLKTQTHTLTTRYAYNPSYSELIDLRLNVWGSQIKTYFDPYPEGQAREPDTPKTMTFGGELFNTSRMATPLGGLTLGYGASFLREIIEMDDSYAVSYGRPGTPPRLVFLLAGPAGKRTLVSAFGKASLELTDWLTVTGGLRYEHYAIEQTSDYLIDKGYEDSDGERLNPSVSVTVTPFEGIQVYVLYSEGWRPPSLREAAHINGTILFPNPDLKPETSRNYEIGLNVLREGLLLENDSLRFKAAYFDNSYDDYIIRYSSAGREPYSWGNIDKAKFRGLEFTAGYDMGVAFFEGSLTHYLKVEYCTEALGCGAGGVGTDYGVNYVPPETSASVTLGGRLFDQSLVFGVRATFNSGRAMEVNANLSNSTMIWPESTVYDAFASYEVMEGIQFNLSAENLTDQYYADPLSFSGVPSPGLTIRAGVTFSF